MRSCLLSTAVLLSALYPLQRSEAQDGAPTIAVRAADLDLTTLEGRLTFDRRVAEAARSACRELAVGSPFDWGAVTECKRKMRVGGRKRARIMAADAQRRSQLAGTATAR